MNTEFLLKDKKTAILVLLGVAVLLVGLGITVVKVFVFSGGVPTPPGGVVGLEHIIPSSDVSGKDLADVPRPSGFVRAEYREDKDDYGRTTLVIISYRTFGDRYEEVVNFYKEKMPEYGWQLVSFQHLDQGAPVFYVGPGVRVTLEKETELQYARGDLYSAYITIRKGKVNDREITDVEVQWEYYPPEGASGGSGGEEAQGSYTPIQGEPYIKEVASYPGAVLYNRETSTLGGVTGYSDHYFVENANVAEVYNFYMQHVPEGYQLVGGEQNENGATVYYSSDSTTIIVAITPKENPAGVEITVSKIVGQ